jgi:hypothetical protein
MRLWRWSVLLLLGAATAAFGGRLSFQEHAAVQESLSRVHPRMRASWLRERGIDDPYYTGVGRSDSGQGLVEVGRWSYGPSYDVDGRATTSETLVALARGSGVSLLRFSRQDSLSIELLSDINAEGLMCRVKVVDTLLYVGSRKGLEVYNIANEQNPVRLSWTPMPLNDFALRDSLAYTIGGYYTDSGGDDSFRIYNVSNPASPVFRGACCDSGYLVSVSGNTAFIGDRWGLYVIDVTSPTSPHRIASWGTDIEQVEARGHLCYVTTGSSEPGDITFHILDVTVPSLPYQIGSLDSVGGNDVCLIDTLVYGAGETYLDKMTIVSVADSTRPRLIGSAGRPGYGEGVWASGLAQVAFVGAHFAGVQIYDTRSTTAPVRDTFILNASMAMDVCIDNGKAYVADEECGLKILDVSNPKKPTTLGSCDSTFGEVPYTTSVVARDSFAFADWYGVQVPFFRVVDVSDPSRPMLLGGVDVFSFPEAMVLRDSFVYVAEKLRFQIVNVARPREPVLVGSCVSNDGVEFGLAIQDTLAYVAGGPTLQVISVADPSSPYIAGEGGRPSEGIAVRDSFAYIPYPYDTLFVYSVADPTSFRMLSAVPASVWPWDVVLGESKLYAGSCADWCIDVFDLSNPGQPVRVGRASAPNGLRRLRYVDGHLYATMWEAGVAVYETTSVGIQEKPGLSDKPAGLRVWPSLVRDEVRFEVVAAARATFIAVFDISGTRLKNVPLRVNMKGGAASGVIDLAGLSAGVYVVRVESAGKSFTAKVVKANRR